MSQKINISSLIIAKDEADNIGRCINSQLKCVDDIVVLVDDKTNDRTFEIAGSYDKVYTEKINWRGFAETKVYGLTKCKYDWVLWIDADEALTPELSDEIMKFKEELRPFSAYSMPRKAYFLGKFIKHSGWYPARVTRLFNKKLASFSDNSVHEHLIVSGSIGELKSDIEHFTDPTITHYFNKFNRYTSLAAEELHRKNKQASLFDILFRPAFLFFKMYILRRGFLDGTHGLILAVLSSAYVFTKYCKLWELNRKEINYDARKQ